MEYIIKNVDMCAASNGLIVAYDKYSPPNDADPYQGNSYSGRHKEVFKLNEKSKAMDCFIEYNEKAGVIISDDTEEK